MRRAALLLAVIACGGEPFASDAPHPSADDVADGAVEPAIRELFDRHAKALSDHTLVTTVSSYAPAYVLAVPAGSQVMTNDDEHRSAVLATDAYYRITLGLTSARLAYIAETPLGEHHAIVRTRLACTFARTHDRVTELPRTYLVDVTTPRSPRITAEIVESDEPATFHAIGLF